MLANERDIFIRYIFGAICLIALCRVTPGNIANRPVVQAQALSSINTTVSSITEEMPIVMSRGAIQRDRLSTAQAIDKQLNGLLAGKGQVYVDAGELEGVNPILLAAISFHETRVKEGGKWVCNSNVLRVANNVAGINHVRPFEKYGRYNKYASIDRSIYDMAFRLKFYYIDGGRTNITLIGEKWAPVNDHQQGMMGMDNVSWGDKVTEIYNNIKSYM